MKIIKIIKAAKHVDENTIRAFLTKNFPQEMLNGLAYDDPDTIQRALRWLGIDNNYEEKKEEKDYSSKSA